VKKEKPNVSQGTLKGTRKAKQTILMRVWRRRYQSVYHTQPGLHGLKRKRKNFMIGVNDKWKRKGEFGE